MVRASEPSGRRIGCGAKISSGLSGDARQGRVRGQATQPKDILMIRVWLFCDDAPKVVRIQPLVILADVEVPVLVEVS